MRDSFNDKFETKIKTILQNQKIDKIEELLLNYEEQIKALKEELDSLKNNKSSKETRINYNPSEFTANQLALIGHYLQECGYVNQGVTKQKLSKSLSMISGVSAQNIRACFSNIYTSKVSNKNNLQAIKPYFIHLQYEKAIDLIDKDILKLK